MAVFSESPKERWVAQDKMNDRVEELCEKSQRVAPRHEEWTISEISGNLREFTG